MSLFPFPSAQTSSTRFSWKSPSCSIQGRRGPQRWGTFKPRPLWTEEKFPTLFFAPSGRLQELTESLQTLLFHGDDCGPDRDWEEVSHGLEKIFSGNRQRGARGGVLACLVLVSWLGRSGVWLGQRSGLMWLRLKPQRFRL